MGLKKLIGALLPRDYREQVLGDLHERDFRLRDIAGILPLVWWSHLTRAAHRPLHADINHAWQRSYARTRWFALLYAVSLAIQIPFEPARRNFSLVVIAALAIVLPLSVLKVPARRLDGEALRKFVRSRLESEEFMAAFGMPYFILSFPLAAPIEAFWGRGAKVLFVVAWGAACFAYGRRHSRRLRKELDELRRKRLQQEIDGLE